jgi:hypothetical protein
MELLRALEWASWTIDDQQRVHDETGALIGTLDAELTAELLEFFGELEGSRELVLPRAAA